MLFSTVRQIFRQTLVDEIAGDYPIFFENVAYAPVANQTHLRVAMIPSNGLVIDMQGTQENGGIFSIGIYAQADIGENELATITDRLYNFYKSTFYYNQDGIQIAKNSVSVSQIRRLDNWAACNVDVTWITYS